MYIHGVMPCVEHNVCIDYVMYHFAWADQREKQGCKSDVSLKRGTQLVVSWENKPLI